ncbi:MAG: porin [Henriciella sp.]
MAIVAAWSAPCLLDASGREPSITISPSFKLQYDVAFVDLPAEPSQTPDYLRRLRAGASGDIGEATSYKLELDIDEDGGLELTSAYVDVPIASTLTLRIGQDKPPVSLEEMTSSSAIAFTERASFTDAFGFDRRLGASVRAETEFVQLSFGAYGENIAERALSGGYALAARAVFSAPISDGRVHFGVSTRLRSETDDDSFSYASPFPARVSYPLVQNGLAASEDLFLGGEFAATWRGLWASGEVAALKSACGCHDDVASGGYISAGAVFGGERRLSGGRFVSPSVRRPIREGGSGVFGVSARFDRIELPRVSTRPELAETLQLGFDWWPDEHLRLSLGAFHTRATNVRWTDPANESASASGAMARFQLTY